MSYAPMTRRVQQPWTGPREHTINMWTREPGQVHTKNRIITGSDVEVIAWLRAVADDLERGTVST